MELPAGKTTMHSRFLTEDGTERGGILHLRKALVTRAPACIDDTGSVGDSRLLANRRPVAGVRPLETGWSLKLRCGPTTSVC